MTQSNWQLAHKAQPAVVALLDIYGDPSDPDGLALINYAQLANNPHAQKVLGKAFAYLNNTDEAVDSNVGSDMTDQEASYFDTATATLAAIDTTGSVGRLEVPLIGTVTTPDSRSYLDLMLQDSERLRVDLDGMPDNRRAVWWLEYRTDQIIDKLNVGCEK